MDKLYDNGGIVGVSRNLADNNRYITSGTLFTPSYVGGSIAVLGSTPTTYTITLTSLAGGVATAPSADDFVFVMFGHADRTDRILTVTTPTYTQLTEGYINNTGATGQDLNYYFGYKVLTSSDTEIVVNNGVSITGRTSVYGVHVWRNIDTANPIDASLGVYLVTNAGPRPFIPSVSPTNRNAVIIGGAIASMPNTVAGDFSTLFLNNFIENSVVNVSSGSVIGLGSRIWKNNMQSPVYLGTFTYTTTQSSTNTAVGASLALKPKDTRVFGNYKNSGVWNIDQQKSLEYVGGFTYSTLPTTGVRFHVVSLSSLYGGSGTSPQVGDLVLVAAADSGSIPVISSATTLTDYTLVTAANRTNATFPGNAITASIYYKVLASTDNQFLVDRVGGLVGRGLVVGVQVWRNESSIPIDIPSIIQTAGDGTIDLQTRNVLTPGAVLSYIAARGQSRFNDPNVDHLYSHPYFDNLGSMTLVANTTSVTFGMASEYTKGGIYDPTNFDSDQASSNTQVSLAAAVAIRPQNNQIRKLDNIKNSIYRFGQ
jgi:hypothetical protein